MKTFKVAQKKTYKVVQNLEWSCPSMLVFVEDGKVLGYQTNPENKLTQMWAEDEDDWGKFNPGDYQEVIEIKK